MKSNNINPVSFKQLQLYAEKGERLPENPIVITFDDGERSFITKVLPLLEEYGYPANMNIVGSLVELYTKNGDTDDRYAYLNENDIKKLAKNDLVALGCHSYNLHSLSTRRGMGKIYGENEEEYKGLIYNDIEKFNIMLERITGEKPEVFAYPYGIKNDTLKAIVKENGFKITLTCREEANRISVGDSLEDLGRFNRPYGISTESFFEKIYRM
ncbi:MAG: polysaccharide deacetylase family protein [Clostridia bacterium]|nr:polysaccharide deacetylase family protein [Clostridia bacterium]